MKITWNHAGKLKSEDVQTKILACGLTAFLVLLLIPLFRIGHYNFISVDDFEFASVSVPVWEESHSVWKVLWNQVEYAKTIYDTWQGPYFSVWLLSSLLGFFSQNAYFVGTYLALGALVVCELFSFTAIMRKVLHADLSNAVILAVGCISMQILLTTVPVEAYYWFTSAIVYTFIYALTILLSAFLVLFYHGKGSRSQVVLFQLVFAVLNIAIGGSNYVTALCMVLIYLFACTCYFVKRHKFRFFILAQFVIFLAAFLLNIMAPGNQVRQSSSGMDHLPAIRSILLSCREAADYLMTWTILPVVIMGILLIPIILRITGNREYRYPFPALVSLISFGLFAAQFTPTIYALGITGAGRVQNLYRFSMFLFLYGNEIYWLGWLQRKGLDNGIQAKTGTCWILPIWMIGGMILLYSLHIWGGSTLTSLSAWNSLRSGEARQYYREYENRCALLEDSSQTEVTLPAYSVKPYLLYFNDIAEDPSDWVNQAVAKWYHKDRVILQE